MCRPEDEAKRPHSWPLRFLGACIAQLSFVRTRESTNGRLIDLMFKTPPDEGLGRGSGDTAGGAGNQGILQIRTPFSWLVSESLVFKLKTRFCSSARNFLAGNTMSHVRLPRTQRLANAPPSLATPITCRVRRFDGHPALP